MAWRKDGSQFGHVARLAGAVLAASLVLTVASPADARHRHVRHHAQVAHHAHVSRPAQVAHRAAAGVPSSPTFSAIVVDANSGRTLFSADPDGLRHPASITKVMTLYLLFEQLDKGAMTLQSRIPITEHAAAQEPSKLGLDPGETISVEDAIKAVVTRSANDIAVAIAEAIGRDESTFAEMMTRKARALGMANTLYRNASGLPNDQQITTARDLTILARSLEDRFPRYFRYFSTEQFEYEGRTIGSHNHLLGRIDGVDGIKTGYTRASGFNLLTSVHRDGRSLIAVVMGGRTAAARDRVMANLIEDHVAQCSTVRTATRVADASSDDDATPAEPVAAEPARPRLLPVAAKVPSRLAATKADSGEGDDSEGDDSATLRVSAVRAVAPHPAPAASGSASRRSPQAQAGAKASDAGQRTREVADATPPAKPKLDPPGRIPSGTTVAARATDDSDDDDTPADGKRWKIQIGATDNAAKAAALLDRARRRDGGLLASAKPMTQKVRKGDSAFYRAQFAGLEQASAESACRSLKRSGFSCFATRD